MQRILVDGMNVIGSRPDGWWRDREGAALRLLERLRRYTALDDTEVTLVLDGRSSRALQGGAHEGVRVCFARDAGFANADDLIVELLREDGSPESVEVITSDRALRERVLSIGASVASPRLLLQRLDDLAV
jgi:predicted RNA-binding protein with PIN domain